MESSVILERGKILENGDYIGSYIESIDDLDYIDDPSEKLWFSPLFDVMEKHPSVLFQIGFPYLPPVEQMNYCIGAVNSMQIAIAQWGGGGRFRNKLGLLFSGAYKWANADDSNFKSKIPKELLEIYEMDDKLIGGRVVGKNIIFQEQYKVLNKLPKKLRKPCKWWIIRYGELDMAFFTDCVNALNNYLYEASIDYTPPETLNEWINRVSIIRRKNEGVNNI